MTKKLEDLFVDCTHHFYEIQNKRPWDVHDKWVDIKGYDLVLCLRLTYLVQSSYHLLREMKKTAESNKTFISDFVSGNIQDAIYRVCFDLYNMLSIPKRYIKTKHVLVLRDLVRENFSVSSQEVAPVYSSSSIVE